MQTEQLLCWSVMTDTELSGLNEEEYSEHLLVLMVASLLF